MSTEPGNSGDRLADLATRATRHHDAGEANSAMSLAREARDLCLASRLAPSVEVATAVNAVGKIFFETGYLSEALDLYQRSQTLAQHLDPQKPEMLATLANNVGQARLQRGELGRARAALEEAVRLVENHAPDSLELAVNCDNLGNVYLHLRELDEAEALHHRAIAIFECERGPFDSHVATAYGNLGQVHRARGSLRQSEAALLRSLDTHERREGLTSHATQLGFANLATFYREAGEHEKADHYTNFLISIGGEEPDERHRSLASLLKRLADDALHRFMLGLALRFARRSVQLLEALEGPNAPATLDARVTLATAHRATGDGPAAIELLRRCLAGYEARDMTSEATATRVELAKAYRENGAGEVAHALLSSSVEELQRRAARNRAQLASALGNLGLELCASGRHAEADRAYRDAIEALGDEDGEDLPWLIHNRGLLAHQLGNHEEASQLYTTAKSAWTSQRGPDHPFVATAAANQALIHWARARSREALAAFAEAESIREPAAQRILAVGSESQRAAYGRQLQSDLYKVVSFCLDPATVLPEADAFAAQFLLNRKGRVLDALAHTFRAMREHASPAERETLLRLDAVRREIADLIAPRLVAGAPTRQPERLAALCAEEERLATELGDRGALRRVGLEPVELERVRDALPEDAALVEILRYSPFDPRQPPMRHQAVDARYAAMVLRAGDGTGRDPVWHDLGEAASIDATVDRWREGLARPDSAPSEVDAVAAELSALVLAPVAEPLEGARHLMVSPDGKLALIPFGLLCAGDASEPPIVSYISSGRDLALPEPSSRSSGAVEIVAAPDFSADVAADTAAAHDGAAVGRRSGFAPLPGTEREAAAIQSLIAGARVTLGPAASVPAIKALHRPAVLHLATHGVFAPLPEPKLEWTNDLLSSGDGVLFVQQQRDTSFANPMFFSGLALAGANKLRAGVATGILMAQEIAGLDLQGTELVVLSACETGLGTVAQGGEFMGLRRALAIAGAATQVTSLWKVADDATCQLMTHFYTRLLAGEGRAAALQSAQECVRDDPDHPEWQHPFYWAAFVCAGAWGDLMSSLSPAGSDRAEVGDAPDAGRGEDA